MGVFQIKHRIFGKKTSRQIYADKAQLMVRKHPFLLFGLPFMSFIVGASFFLSNFTQTRFDYQATRVQKVSQEEKLNLNSERKVLNIQEEYWRLLERQDQLNNWEPKRVERPGGEE